MGKELPSVTTPATAEHDTRARRIRRGIVTGLGVFVLAVLVWRSLFVPVSVDLVVEPTELVPDGQSTATIMVAPVNRLGMHVPFRRLALVCTIEEGHQLATLSYNADSTIVTLTAGTDPGEVVLRIDVSGFPFTMEARIALLPAMAEARAE